MLERYMSVFAPFVATVVLAHFIARSSGAWQVESLGLASPRLLRRALAATATAIAIIVGVDLLTGGALFLHPSSPRSEILIGLTTVALLLGRSVAGILVPLAQRMTRRPSV